MLDFLIKLSKSLGEITHHLDFNSVHLVFLPTSKSASEQILAQFWYKRLLFLIKNGIVKIAHNLEGLNLPRCKE